MVPEMGCLRVLITGVACPSVSCLCLIDPGTYQEGHSRVMCLSWPLSLQAASCGILEYQEWRGLPPLERVFILSNVPASMLVHKPSCAHTERFAHLTPR